VTSFTERYFDSLGSFGDVIVSMLTTIAVPGSIKISQNTKAALAKKKAAGVQLGAPIKSQTQVEPICRFGAEGMSSTHPSKALGISASIVAKYLH
jgi:DNA invertase Pin-like site-specific DNA recombinase